ncbi:Cytochrome P450 4F4 [Fukomys damarensis]|uniref:Cytochrome P450 4F4 n=1 Tax=Fukomys damarensis TaxID=885580 RepID=A0A091E497_FUKDA|nr:Cytochrome P450 4F4 [Fukomys damarensis]
MRIVVQTYAFYKNVQQLQGFPQPPKRNWFLGHLGQIQPTEEGLKFVDRMVHTYPRGFVMWFGPLLPVITLCHPDSLRFVLSASGTHVEFVRVVCVTSKGFQPSKPDLPLGFSLFLSRTPIPLSPPSTAVTLHMP